MSLSESTDYRWIDGVEGLELYEPGGHHPVMIDDVLHNRYRIVDKLGFGGFSTVWLARDLTKNRNLVVKVGRSSVGFPRKETEILQALQTPKLPLPPGFEANPQTNIPSIFDTFDVRGPNGTHTCYTLTPAQGNLKEKSFSRLFPVQVARALAAKLARAVAYVHSQGFVHGDIHLRNILIKFPSELDDLSLQEFRKMFGGPETVPVTRVDNKPLTPNVPSHAVVPLNLGKYAEDFTIVDAHGLILSDFGQAFSPDTEQRLGKDCNTPVASRAPETYFEPNRPISFSSDIWSLGTAIWEILGMKPLFSEIEEQDEVVAEQIDVLGIHNLPAPWRRKWEGKDIDWENWNTEIPRLPFGKRTPWPVLEDAFQECVQEDRREMVTEGVFEEGEETEAILELIRGMLTFNPEERWTIDMVLHSKWMAQWALPELEKTA
ncbi:kinase-like protein [Periconia macrospinosa]|uniref:Kinase-like protein n=1 Tax=Periconia macrospinosa TaxID=97972 RepID=A0A2V1D708_9PLEO|nr:kinase-like protein [Periconia macrospinosa]